MRCLSLISMKLRQRMSPDFKRRVDLLSPSHVFEVLQVLSILEFDNISRIMESRTKTSMDLGWIGISRGSGGFRQGGEGKYLFQKALQETYIVAKTLIMSR
ncbi:anaphase-promoting complex subunit CDC26 [Striga asiatica]|uniref:Anaphase-promoting complex subunit CDC26 n=1 Tax=Striga asiatica TaxID=4170 RepID=A0A5A7P135_STRAF|nr:anaphase-promoting complex subunit CDC26 [Striga asiatica]